MEGEVTNNAPSAADLDAVAAEQQTAQDTTSATAETPADPKVAEAEAYVAARGYDPDAAKRIVAGFGADHFLAEKARTAQGGVVDQQAAAAEFKENVIQEEQLASTAIDVTAPSDTGDQISKAVEPPADNPVPSGNKVPPAEMAKSFVTPAPEQATPGERLSKLEADFAALVKLLDEEYSIRPVTKEMAEARAAEQVEREVKQ